MEDYLEKTALNKIKRLMEENAGLNCSGYREEYLKRRFEIRLKATGSNTYGRYLIYLKRNPSEFDNLLNDLTVNYTTFFRDTDVYQYLEKTLLPKLLSLKSPLRIWSAGCATGEEPYSLSILIHKILGKTLRTIPVTIYASDIDKDALSKASLGQYLPRQLGAISKQMTEDYFTPIGDLYQVKDFLKQIIHFEQFDLMKAPQHHNLDLILCRNVMIYFAKESQQQIHMSFFNALKDGGYFVTGKSEILTGEPAQKFSAIDHYVRVYQKPQRTKSTLYDKATAV